MKKFLVFFITAVAVMVAVSCASAPDFAKFPADSGVIAPHFMIGEKAADKHDSSSYQFGNPKSLAVDSEGNVYCSSKNFDLTKFSPDGEFIAVIGEYGKGKGQWAYPKGLAINSKDQIVISDAKLSKVLVLAQDGSVVVEFGQEGKGEADFTDVGPCAVDAEDNIYVSDDTNGIMVFDAAGNFIKTIVAPVDSDKGTREMGYVAVSSESGRLYIADDGEGEVDVYDLATGDFLLSMGGHGPEAGKLSEDIEGICEGPWGLVFAVDENGGKIQVYQEDGTFVTAFGNAGIYEGEFADAEGLAYDAANRRIVIADEKNFRIQSFNLSDIGL